MFKKKEMDIDWKLILDDQLKAALQEFTNKDNDQKPKCELSHLLSIAYVEISPCLRELSFSELNAQREKCEKFLKEFCEYIDKETLKGIGMGGFDRMEIILLFLDSLAFNPYGQIVGSDDFEVTWKPRYADGIERWHKEKKIYYKKNTVKHLSIRRFGVGEIRYCVEDVNNPDSFHLKLEMLKLGSIDVIRSSEFINALAEVLEESEKISKIKKESYFRQIFIAKKILKVFFSLKVNLDSSNTIRSFEKFFLFFREVELEGSLFCDQTYIICFALLGITDGINLINNRGVVAVGIDKYESALSKFDEANIQEILQPFVIYQKIVTDQELTWLQFSEDIALN
ncbi:hypothetical protein N8778_02940 [Verrucomicrobia bacterium]|nr:hypothetical protein [Verrucomicrobiota bacterium]